MMKISNLGYLVISSQDPESWRTFGLDVIGAMEATVPGAEVALKIDEHPYRFIIESGDVDQLTAIGWEMATRTDFEALREHLQSKGLRIRNGAAEEAEKRFVTDFFATEDPSGNPLEFYYGRTGCGEPFVSPIGVPGFVTGEMGLGHLVVPASGGLDETHSFYTSVLGFGDSDNLTISFPPEDMPDVLVRFMHVENPRHHSLALTTLPSPTGIVHVMLEMEDLDNVGHCLDRVMANGMSLMASLGRHCNDNMLSFYVNGPANIPVEIGCDGLQLDWRTFEPTTSTVPDIWGHAYNLG